MDFNISIVVRDAVGRLTTQSVPLSVLDPIAITGTLPSGNYGSAYSATLSITGGQTPFTIAASNLPAGLTASISGRTITIAGTPTAPSSAEALLYGANLEGRDFYTGPRQFTDLINHHTPQSNSAGSPSLDSSRFDSQGRLLSVPSEGAFMIVRRPTVAGARVRLVWEGAATCTPGLNTQGSKTSGTYSNGKKWIEFNHPAGAAEIQGDTAFIQIQGDGTSAIQISSKFCAEPSKFGPNGEYPTGDARLDPDYVATIKRDLTRVRLMDWFAINGVSDISFTSTNRAKPTDVFDRGMGCSIEDAAALIRMAEVGVHFCFPWTCDQSFVTEVMTQLNAATPAGKQIEVECSNEVWNPLFRVFAKARDYWIASNPSANAGDFGTVLAGYNKRHNEVMTMVETACQQLGISFGENGRVVRVLGCQIAPGTAKSQIDLAVPGGHTDRVATAPYFGSGAYNQSPTTDVATLHRRLLFGIDSVLNSQVEIRNYAVSKGFSTKLYECGAHMEVPNGSLVSTVSDVMTADPNYEKVISYYLQELKRRSPNTPLDWFVYVARNTPFGNFFLKNSVFDLDGTGTGGSGAFRAFLKAKQNIFNPPAAEIVNTPQAVEVNKAFTYTADVRWGQGTGSTRTFSGTGTLPPGLTLNTSTGVISGTPTTVGSYNYTLTATDTKGPAAVAALTFVINPVETFTFTDNAVGVGSTSQALSTRGWALSGTGTGYAKNGAVRAESAPNATVTNYVSIGTGANRRLNIDIDRSAYGQYVSVEFSLFRVVGGKGLSVYIRGNGPDGLIQVYRNGTLFSNIGNVPAATTNLILEVNNHVLTIRADGTQIAQTTVGSTLADYGDASAMVGFMSYNQDGDTSVIYKQFRAKTL